MAFCLNEDLTAAPKGLILISGTWAGSFPRHHTLNRDSPALLGTPVHISAAEKRDVCSTISEIHGSVRKWTVRSTNSLWESDSTWHDSECVDKHHKTPRTKTAAQGRHRGSCTEYPELAASLPSGGSWVCRP